MKLSLLDVLTQTRDAVNALNKKVRKLETPGSKKKTKARSELLPFSRKDLQKISHQLGLHEESDFPYVDRRLDAFYRQREYSLFSDFNSGTGLDKFLEVRENRINLIKFLINNSRNKLSKGGIDVALVARLFTIVFDYKPDDDLLQGVNDDPALTKITELLNKIYKAPKVADTYADIGLLQAYLLKASDEELMTMEETDHFLFNTTMDHALEEAKAANASTLAFRSILSKHFTRFENIKSNFLNNDFSFSTFQKISLEGKELDSIEIMHLLNEYHEEEMQCLGHDSNIDFSGFLDMNGKDSKALFATLQDPVKTADLLKHLILSYQTESDESEHEGVFAVMGSDDDLNLKTTDLKEVVLSMLPKVFTLATDRTFGHTQDDNAYPDLLTNITSDSEEQERLLNSVIDFLIPNKEISEARWRDVQWDLKPILALLLYRSLDETEYGKLEVNEAGLQTLSKFVSKYHQHKMKFADYNGPASN